MDTRFWGPSGWKLLHLISFDFRYSAESSLSYANFLETIPYVLPCKFCRASLTDFYRQHPYSMEPNAGILPTLNMRRWMFQIHNCVNGKLRKQGLHPAANPTYTAVHEEYTKLQRVPWDQQLLLLWDFLFAVAYHHPKESAHSSPMPDCPAEAKRCKDPCERNKWNVLPWTKRMHWFRRFWVFLPAVLPQEIAVRWKEAEKKNPPTWACRRSTLAWLWRMRCSLDTTFRDPYQSVCKRVAGYSSDCGTKRGGITCRRKPHRAKTVKKTDKRQ